MNKKTLFISMLVNIAFSFSSELYAQVLSNYYPPDYSYFNPGQGEYDADLRNCANITNEWCDEAQGKGITAYPVEIRPKDSTTPSHAMVIVKQASTDTTITYCLVEPQDGSITGCWTEEINKPTPANPEGEQWPAYVPKSIYTDACENVGVTPNGRCEVHSPDFRF